MSKTSLPSALVALAVVAAVAGLTWAGRIDGQAALALFSTVVGGVLYHVASSGKEGP